MNDADLLEALLLSLASGESVYSRWCWSSGAALAHHVYELAKTAEADWAHGAVLGATGPTTLKEIEAALRPVTPTFRHPDESTPAHHGEHSLYLDETAARSWHQNLRKHLFSS
jgi:hypothetical protein